MELGSVAMSPPYDRDELFPGLLSTLAEDNASTLAPRVANEAVKLGLFPSIASEEGGCDGDGVYLALLKSSYDRQTGPPSVAPAEGIPNSTQRRALSPSSTVTSASSNPETVVTVLDEDGKEREYSGPNRNAIMARLNRERKKKKIVELEETVEGLSTENRLIKADRLQLEHRVTNLEMEVDYLKGVLANQSELSGLLSNIKATSLSFHTSMDGLAAGEKPPARNKRSTSTGEGSNKKRKSVKITNPLCLETIKSQPSMNRSSSRSEKPPKSALFEDSLRAREGAKAAGVCLHVRNKKVSLEFCNNCSTRAEAAFRRDGDESP